MKTVPLPRCHFVVVSKQTWHNPNGQPIWTSPCSQCLSREQLLLYRSHRDRPSAGSPWPTGNWPVIKACPFLSQAKLRDRISPQRTKGRSTSGDGLCYEMTSHIPCEVQKPWAAALLLVLLLTYHHHSQETWMKPSIFQYSLFQPRWGFSSVHTPRESVR